MLSEREHDLQIHGEPNGDMLTMEVSISKGRLKADHEATILEHIQTIIGGGYHLTLNGAANTALVTQMQKRMSPRLIWVRALLWEQIDTAQLLKVEADQLAKDGHLVAAILRLFFIAQHLDLRVRQMDSYYEGEPAEARARSDAEKRWLLLDFDVQMSIAALKLKIRANDYVRQGEVLLDMLEDAPEYNQYSDKMRVQHRLLTLQMSMVKHSRQPLYDRLHDMNAFFASVEDFHSENPDLVLDEYVVYDHGRLVIVAEQLAHVCTNSFACTPTTLTSFRAGMFQLFRQS